MSSKKTPKDRRSLASSSPLATGNKTPKRTPGGNNKNSSSHLMQWGQCPKSGLFRLNLNAESHDRWNASECDLDHIVYDEKEEQVTGPAAEPPKDSRPRLPRSVFLPESLMRLWGVAFGDFVAVINENNSKKSVARVFPLRLPSANHICLTPDLIEQFQDSVTCRLSKHGGPVLPVRSVTLTCLNCDDSPAKEDLEEASKVFLEDSVLTLGEILSVPIYCRTAKLEVTELTLCGASDQVSQLTEQVQKINLDSEKKSFSSLSGFLTCASRLLIRNLKKDAEDDQLKDFVPGIDELAGIDDKVDRLKKIMSAALIPSRDGNKRVMPYHGVILWGPPGTGKTTLGMAVAAEMGARLVPVAAGELSSKLFGETEKNLRRVFAEAESSQPCVVFLDEVDVLCGGGGKETDGGQRQRIVSTLASLLDDVRKKSLRVVVVAATSSLDSVDSRLRSPGRLDGEVELEAPSPKSRRDILAKHIGIDEENVGLCEAEIKEVASWCHGFVGADLQALVQAALEETEGEDPAKLTAEHFRQALKRVKPSAMKEVLVEVPSVTWEDIGGMEEVKLSLKQSVSWPLEHPEAFERMGISPPRGVLMYGPPGCSKTMIAKALANESGLNFLSVKGPELFSKWVGESEKAVRELFRKARQVSPAIVFFDEIDALGSERSSGKGGGGSDVGNRVLAQLLTEMDGVETLTGVTVVAATNRPDLIDGALMRPGRLDRQLYVPLPDGATRDKVFRVHCKKKPISDRVDFGLLVAKTEGYSGAEVAAVCNEAAFKAMQDVVEGRVEEKSAEIEERHFELALAAVTPRVKPELLKIYDEFIAKKSNRP